MRRVYPNSGSFGSLTSVVKARSPFAPRDHAAVALALAAKGAQSIEESRIASGLSQRLQLVNLPGGDGGHVLGGVVDAPGMAGNRSESARRSVHPEPLKGVAELLFGRPEQL
jgi:hypothetical protein